jgi:uncharacterized protein (TIGR02145 family)
MRQCDVRYATRCHLQIYKFLNFQTMKKNTFSKNFACLAVAVMASVTTASAVINVSIPADSPYTIMDTTVNANVPNDCHGHIYRWWRNGVYAQVATANLTIPAGSLTPGQTYTYFRTTRCGACGNQVTSDNVKVSVSHSYQTKVYNGVEWMIENSKELFFDVASCTKPPINSGNYGYLYSWSCAHLVCPAGWRWPNHADFIALEAALDAGGASAWADWNSGFSLAGHGVNGTYVNAQGTAGGWWSSSTNLEYWNVNKNSKDGTLSSAEQSFYSFSVRCRKK